MVRAGLWSLCAAAGTQHRGIKYMWAVRGGDDNYAFLRIETVHLHEQRIQCLLALVVAAAHAVAAMTPDGVDFDNENDARSGFLALLKHVADTACADADKHLDKVRAADGKERNIRFACNGARQQCLARARRADHQHAFGNPATEFLKFFRVTQEFDQLLHFVFGFLDPGDVAECELIFVPGEHSRFRFTEIKRAFSSHADLLAKQEIKYEQEQGDRQKTNHGLREHV